MGTNSDNQLLDTGKFSYIFKIKPLILYSKCKVFSEVVCFCSYLKIYIKEVKKPIESLQNVKKISTFVVVF